jgi:hypothetical protein
MTQKIDSRKFAAFALVAALINLSIFLIAKSVDATLVIEQGGSREITAVMVLGISFLALLFAAYLASLIGKKSLVFLKNVPVIGLAFGLLTAVAPFSVSDDLMTSISLASMHIIAGVVWYFGAKRSIH